MPKYSFECTCGLQFTRTLKMGEYKNHACPNCGGEASRLFEGFGFNFAQGVTPGNSGVTKHDYPTADQAVGASADKRWEEYRDREKVKEEVRRVGGGRALVRENGQNYIEYRAGGQETIETRKKVSQELTEVLKRPSS
jgi:putative FmdB family regulatory protein